MASSHDSQNNNPPIFSLYDSTPLYYRSDEIRLLTIQPGQYHDPIQMEIRTVGLDSHPKFNALSYAWSKDGPDATVRIGVHGFKISQTLHHALLRMRKSTEESVFWIDAICINQESTAEKNHQVPMMGRIYSSASEVVIWLGEPTKTLKRALGFLEFLDENMDPECNSTDLEEGRAYILSHTPSQQTALDASLIALVQKPWFRRTWILQEAILPPNKPRFLCGSQWISWDCLVSLDKSVDHYLHHRHNHKCDTHDPQKWSKDMHKKFEGWAFTAIYHQRSIVQMQRPCAPPLDRALLATRNAMASDPRDRIYGVLGMTCEDCGVQVPVDYGKPVTEVFRDAMSCLLLKSGPTPLLIKEKELIDGQYSLVTESAWEFDPARVSGASWIPDFAKTFSFHDQKPFSGDVSPFDAASGIPHSLTIKGNSLISPGLLVDVIQHTRDTAQRMKSYETTTLIEWVPILPLLELLWTHTQDYSLEDLQVNGQNCTSSSPQLSIMENLAMLANQVHANIPHQHAAGGDCESATADESHPCVESDCVDNEFVDSAVLESLISPHAKLHAAPEFEKYGLCRDPAGLQYGFWDAAWRTLCADDRLFQHIAHSNTAGDDRIRFALCWESLIRQLDELDKSDDATPEKDTANTRTAESGKNTARQVKTYLNHCQASVDIFRDLSHISLHLLTQREVFVTQNQWIGLGPRVVQPGDVVVILLGGNAPYILRPVEDYYIFVGECYVHGIMDGELFNQLHADAEGGTNGEDGVLNRPEQQVKLQSFEIR